MDVAIIGAGPAGNWLAYLLAKKGINCSVFEEHKKVGMPIQCTGIVTSAIGDIVPLKKSFIINHVKDAQIFFEMDNSIGSQYEVIHGYPELDRRWRFGINWIFWD